MKGKDDPLTSSFDSASYRMVIDLVMAIQAAIVNYQLYPPTSKIITLSMEKAYNCLSSLLQKRKRITLSEFKNNLLIDGKELSEGDRRRPFANSFISLLNKHNIKSISFLKGLSGGEFSSFLEAMSLKPESLKGRGGLVQVLVEKGISNIAIDEKVYIEVAKSEKAVDKLKEEIFVKYLVGKISLAEVEKEGLSEVTTDPRKLAHLVAQVAQEESKAGGGMGRDDLVLSALKRIRELLPGFPDQAIQGELVDELTKMVPSLTPPLLTKVLAQGAGKKVEAEGSIEPFSERALELLTGEEIMKAEEEPLAQWVDRLVKEESAKLLDETVKEIIGKVVKKLDSLKRDDLARMLLDKLTQNLESGSSTTRVQTVQIFIGIFEELISAEGSSIVLELKNHLLERLEKEREMLEVYSSVASALERMATTLVRRGEYLAAGDIIEALGGHRHPRSKRPPEQKVRADEALERIATEEMMRLLASVFKSGNEKLQDEVVKILIKLEERGVKPLIQVLKESEDRRVRKDAVDTLIKMGKSATKLLLEELERENPWYVYRNIIFVLGEIGDSSLVDHLEVFLKYPDHRVRKETIRALFKIGGEEASLVLMGAIADEDSAIRQSVAELLGLMGERRAVPELVKLIENKSLRIKDEEEAVQIEVCRALGRIKDTRALPVLSDVLKRESLWSFRRTKSERVRVAACRALGEIGERAAEEALLRATKDPSALVQSAAREALSKLK